MRQTFRLNYHCSNQGDGSVAVRFHANAGDAEFADESQEEGWGESSASHVDLKVEDGKLFYLDYDEGADNWQKVWKEAT